MQDRVSTVPATDNAAKNCCFCGKPQSEAKFLYDGQAASICDQCVLAASQHLAQNTKQQFTYGHEALRWHFAGLPNDAIVTSNRMFPARMRADLQPATEAQFSKNALRFFGVNADHRYEPLTIASLLKVWQHSTVLAPPSYQDVDVGEDQAVRCLDTGLWLLREDDLPYAVLLSFFQDHFGVTSVRIEVAVPGGDRGDAIVRRAFRELEIAVATARSYRGKVLSFEQAHRYTGASGSIIVHRLPAVAADEVILPERTRKLLERNVLHFAESRANLRKLGMSTKKGILLYGPPGTGKTHTIRYLASNLSGHTTLLVTAEQVGLLAEYFALARLLQPSIIVIEDVDLIARDREGMGTCEEVMLNGLLNEMDGLKEEAEIFFILTTNRPEKLEAALASRPGRIDQAIEIPLPDEAGRTRLVQLYSRGLDVPADLVAEAVQRTQGVSAAFIKELMRRTAQSCVERIGGNRVTALDIRAALEDMLFTGGKLNLKLLGGDVGESD